MTKDNFDKLLKCSIVLLFFFTEAATNLSQTGIKNLLMNFIRFG